MLYTNLHYYAVVEFASSLTKKKVNNEKKTRFRNRPQTIKRDIGVPECFWKYGIGILLLICMYILFSI